MGDDVYLWGLGQASNAISQYQQRQRDAATAATRLKAFDQANAAADDPNAASTATPSPLAVALGQAPSAPASFSSDPSANAAPTPASGALPSIASVQGAPSGSKIGDMLNGLNDQYGLPPGYLTKTAGIESNFNVNAYNKGSGAAGPFQFVPSTASAYGVSNPYDWADSARGAAQLASDNANVLRKTLGTDPTAGQLYLAHQQGATGAAKLLANPNARAGDVVGDAAVRANGGDPSMTAGQFAAKWTSKFDGGQQQQQQAASAAPANPLGPAMPSLRSPQQQAAGSPYGDLSGSSFPGGAPPAQAGAPAMGLSQLAAGSGSGAPSGPPTPQSSPAPPSPLAAASPPRTDAQGNALNPDGTSTALGYNPSTGMVSAPGQAAIDGATNHGQGGFPDISTPTKVSTDPRSPGVFPTPGVGGPPPATQAAAGQGQPYGSQPLNVGGQMLTRQQAEDTDGLDHTDYDAAAVQAGLIRGPKDAPAFQDSAGGNQGVSATPAAAQGIAPVQGAPQSQQSGIPPATPAAPYASPALSAATGVRTAGIPKNTIRILLADPTTSADGMKLWEQTATGKDYGFVAAADGSYWRQDPRTGAMTQLTAAIQAPYSLSAGQTRFGADNQLLRSVPSDAKDAAPKWGVIGEDQYGRKQYGYPPAPGAAPAAATPAPAADSNLHGSDYIKTLDPAVATQVQAIIDGRAAYPTGTQLSRPFGQALAAAVTQADPSFEAGNATARVKVRNEFEAGGPSSPAGMITAGNTAIQHLGELSNDAEALQNSRLPPWNAVTNAFSSGSGGSSVTNFNTTLGHFVEEAVKFYRGSGGTEADVQRDMANLNANMSPQQLHDAIQKNVALLQGKINALQDRWRQGMGPLVPDFPIVQPKSQAAISTIAKRAGVSLTNDAGGPQGQSQAPQPGAQPGAAPQAGRVQVRGAADYQALPSGTRYIDPNGTPRIKP